MNIKTIVILSVAAVLLLSIGLVLSKIKFNNLGEATKTCKQLSEKLFFIELHGDDGFEDLLKNGGVKSTEEMVSFISNFLSKGPIARNVKPNIKEINAACTTFLARDGKGGYTAARNFDWDECSAIIVKNNPDIGYKSVCTSNLDFLGFGADYVPTKSFINKMKALAALYIPMDGLNEKGLFVADLMAGDEEITNQSTDKPDLTTTAAIRLLLNKAASVDEAINLLEQYDMHSDIGKAHHLFIADSFGKSVVVEYVDNVMYVTESSACTNHYLNGPKAGQGSEGSVERMDVVLKEIKENYNQVDFDAAKKIIMNASGETTQWSVVYSLGKEFSESVYFKRDFSKAYEYNF